MTTLRNSYRGLGLLLELNFDRFAVVLALGGALFLASYLGAP